MQIKELISKQELEAKVRELGKQITKDYEGEEVTLVGLLRGSVVFLADLCREIDLEVKIDFMNVSSYGNSMESSRDVKILKDLDDSIKGKNVIIVEDIIDTGYTLDLVISMLKERQPKSLKIASLLDKPARREINLDIDYVGFVIPDSFIVGYGIDYAQKYRNLNYIGIVEGE